MKKIKSKLAKHESYNSALRSIYGYQIQTTKSYRITIYKYQYHNIKMANINIQNNSDKKKTLF